MEGSAALTPTWHGGVMGQGCAFTPASTAAIVPSFEVSFVHRPLSLNGGVVALGNENSYRQFCQRRCFSLETRGGNFLSTRGIDAGLGRRPRPDVLSGGTIRRCLDQARATVRDGAGGEMRIQR
jgi:hypothetical protein